MEQPIKKLLFLGGGGCAYAPLVGALHVLMGKWRESQEQQLKKITGVLSLHEHLHCINYKKTPLEVCVFDLCLWVVASQLATKLRNVN